MDQVPDIAGICERDIDLLLLEELWSNAAFQERFIVGACGATLGELVEVKRSVTQSSGESDLELTWRQLDGARIRLLIENKVDAGFQRDQAARYQGRARERERLHECERAWTVLLAPLTYLGEETRDLGFDVNVPYERLRDWFLAAELGLRGRYKAGVLTAAINKSCLGYNPIVDDAVSRFWHDYWELAVREAPELAMNRPGSKPARSAFVYFSPDALPSNTDLVHKLTHGFVDLTFGNTGNRLGELSAALQPLLQDGMTLARTGKSTSVRVEVPPLKLTGPVANQRKAVATGLRAACRLLAWMRSHREQLVEFLER